MQSVVQHTGMPATLVPPPLPPPPAPPVYADPPSSNPSPNNVSLMISMLIFLSLYVQRDLRFLSSSPVEFQLLGMCIISPVEHCVC